MPVRMPRQKKTSKEPSDREIPHWDLRREKDLSFMGRALVEVSLPMKPTRGTLLLRSGEKKEVFASKYVRESGPYRVKILADEDYGVPYGKDRLFLYWLITRAVITKSKVIYYGSVRSLLEKELGLEYGTSNRTWLKGAIQRFLHSTVYLEISDGHVHGIEKDTVLRSVVGALDPKRKNEPYTECYFQLSEDFFRELVTDKKAVPFDIEVIRRLGKHYGAMDLYIWWARKNHLEQDREGQYFYASTKSLKSQFCDSSKTPLFRFNQQITERIQILNNVLSDVYGIKANIELIGGKLSFKICQKLTQIPQKHTLSTTPQVTNDPIENPESIPSVNPKFEEIRRRLIGIKSP